MTTIKRETTKEFMKKAAKIRKELETKELVDMGEGHEEVGRVDIGLNLAPMKLNQITFKIEGVTPLLIHSMSAPTKGGILDSMQPSKNKKIKGAPRADKNPEQEYNNSFYELDGGDPAPKGVYVFPVLAFKTGCVTSLTFSNPKLTRPAARQMMFILPDKKYGSVTQIHTASGPRVHEVKVRIGMGKTDLRYRPEFVSWGMELTMKFNPHHISSEQIIELLDTAGLTVGVGEWRPEKGGSHGTFQVVSKFSWEK